MFCGSAYPNEEPEIHNQTMKKISWTTLLLLVGAHYLPAAANDDATEATATISFYTTELPVQYHTDLLTPQCAGVHEKGIVQFYQQLEKTNYRILLNDLLQKKEALSLNDWLFYRLVHQSVVTIFQHKSPVEQGLLGWFLLSQAGFDTRLTYFEQEVFVYVHSTDQIFEVPLIQEQDKLYVNLRPDNSPAQKNSENPLYMLNFVARPDGRAFSFYLREPPRLPAQPITRKVTFPWQGQPLSLDIQYDKTLVELMKTWPLVDETVYLKFPMSEVLAQSLLPQFRDILRDKTPRQSVELLLAFTRSAFEYKEDTEYFGRSKPMVTDEVFFYPYSDCEDRSALFFNLVKNLLDLPMIVLAFPNHLTIAVAIDETLPGAVITHEGRRYYVCDPTGPVNSSEIGVFPREYEESPFEVILSYR